MEISVPSICNGLDKCDIYKIDPKIKMINHKEFIEGIEDIVSEEKKITSNKENIVEDVKEDIKVKDIKEDKKEDIKEDIKEDVKEESFEKKNHYFQKIKILKKMKKKM